MPFHRLTSRRTFYHLLGCLHPQSMCRESQVQLLAMCVGETKIYPLSTDDSIKSNSLFDITYSYLLETLFISRQPIATLISKLKTLLANLNTIIR